MSGRKFFAFMSLFFALFFVIALSGCGGGGGSGGSNDNNNNHNQGTTYTVKFDSNGGSEVASMTVSADTTIEAPDEPTKASSIFAGWFKDNNEFTQIFMFGLDGEKISRDLTLYAQWANDDPDQDEADIAAALIAIIYQPGDGPDYVTRNLTLPAQSEGINITWASNSGLISSTGQVTRPTGNDAEVILTATITNAGKSASKTFTLKVIHARTRKIDDVKASADEYPVIADEIITMNESNDNFNIVYDDNEEQIRHIDGKFSNLEVKNADDALDAAYEIHEALGITDPYNETEPLNVTRDDYGAQYSFRQIYSNSRESAEVFGRTLMISANSEGETDFLSSSFIATESLDVAFPNGLYFSHTEAEAERAALANYPGTTGLEVISSETKKIIYSLGEYEANPEPAFVVKVTGNDINQTVIVGDYDLNVIEAIDDVCTWTTYNYGTDELGHTRSFPVTVKGRNNTKYLRDSGSPEVIVYSQSESDSNIPTSEWGYKNSWTDRHQIAAFANMRLVLRWWKDTFNRNSLDDKGMAIKLITHRSGYSDNACWNSSNKTISVGDISDTTLYDKTRAIGLDTLTHETGHAVLYYITGGISYQNATGAINDGYADIFGCLRDKDWRHGWRADYDNDPDTGFTYFIDNTQCLRDAREDVTVKSLSAGARSSYGLSGITTMDELYEHYRTVAPQYYGNDGNGCHTYCRLVTHAAYLMHEDGASKIGRSTSQALTWNEVGWVWYKSLSFGLDNTSNFHTVRRNVIRAALQMGLSDTKILTIKKAFDKVEISEAKGTLRGKITDWDTSGTITGGATVALRDDANNTVESVIIDQNGNYELKADAGNYNVIVSPTFGSYRAYQERVYIPANKTVRLDAELVKTGTGNITLHLSDENDNSVSGVSISAVNNYTRTSAYPTYSGGTYTFSNINSGNYTIYVGKTGYDYHKFAVTVPPNETRNIYRTLYRAAKCIYTVYFECSSKTFLAPNLLIKYSGGSIQRVNSSNTPQYAPNGRQAGVCFYKDGGKSKYIRFTNFASTEYKFYVVWDGGESVDWNGAKPKVSLYFNGDFREKFTPPSDASTGGYWEVFRINNKGNRYRINSIVEAEPVID